jgi:hypothetical protein
MNRLLDTATLWPKRRPSDSPPAWCASEVSSADLFSSTRPALARLYPPITAFHPCLDPHHAGFPASLPPFPEHATNQYP